MDFFVDTADLDQIKEAYSWGITNGVTTNPSLIKKAVAALQASGASTTIGEYIEEILRTAGSDPVSLEVIGATEAEMFEQGMFLFERFNSIAGNVVVKVPVNPRMDDGGADVAFDGLKVIKRLADRDIPVNTTLIFSPEQALLALLAEAGQQHLAMVAGEVFGHR